MKTYSTYVHRIIIHDNNIDEIQKIVLEIFRLTLKKTTETLNKKCEWVIPHLIDISDMNRVTDSIVREKRHFY